MNIVGIALPFVPLVRQEENGGVKCQDRSWIRIYGYIFPVL